MSLPYTELAEKARISQSFACQLLNGERSPSLRMAFQIYDSTGLQFGILEGIDAQLIEQLRPKANAA